jgi:hypothetical protein
MPTICHVSAAGASVVMRPRYEHCPAHVHAVNTSKKWEIKVFFAYADNDPQHLTIDIVYGIPLLAQINSIIDAVAAHLDRCRASWWTIVSDTCLVNQNLTVSADGVVTKTSATTAVKAIAARYEPSNLSVSFIGQASLGWLVGRCPKEST